MVILLHCSRTDTLPPVKSFDLMYCDLHLQFAEKLPSQPLNQTFALQCNLIDQR